MMKAAQQGGGGGGGQHGSLLAGGTALPGGPSPQPGQPGSLMQGGAYRITVKKAIISIVWWISDLRNDREAFNYYLYVCVCIYISGGSKPRIEIAARFLYAFNEIENFIQSYRFSRIDARSDSWP